MVIVQQDQRPRDWAYMASFKENDLPSLQEMVKHIRETHDIDMIERFNDNCEQFLKGENTDFLTAQPIRISKTDDLVVNGGLQQCINLILGTSGARWSYIIVSRNNVNVPPSPVDTILNTTFGGPHTLALASYGWLEAKGMKLFFGVIGPQDNVNPPNPLPNSTINEMGVYNGPTMSDVMLNHETFFNNQLTRDITQDLEVYASIFLFSCVIEFCPMA